jgi:hypothetical protein
LKKLTYWNPEKPLARGSKVLLTFCISCFALRAKQRNTSENKVPLRKTTPVQTRDSYRAERRKMIERYRKGASP